jgi:hypothetical protein
MSEPVAFIKQGDDGYPRLVQNPLLTFSYSSILVKQPDIPLYTHPMRELTDEEIYAEMIKCIDEPEDGHTFRYKDFARAVLKKASEK